MDLNIYIYIHIYIYISGLESEQTLGDSKRQGSLVCCSAWGHKELDMTQRLNSNNIVDLQCYANLCCSKVTQLYTCIHSSDRLFFKNCC